MPLHKKNAMPIERLRELLECDPENGLLFWKPRNPRDFCKSENSRAAIMCEAWNARSAGRQALATVTRQGYIAGRILGKHFKAHRVIWALTHDRWPTELDHINGDRGDNRLSNLREASRRQNGRNRALSKRNKTGYPGVEKRGNSFHAAIKTVDFRRNLGTFKTLEEAVAARKKIERELGFHKNHGRPS